MSLVKKIIVFLDAGLQKAFIPLRIPQSVFGFPENAPKSLKTVWEDINELNQNIPDELRQEVDSDLDFIFQKNEQERPKLTINPQKDYIKGRFGTKTWHLKNGNSFTIEGIWLLIETNTSKQDGNIHLPDVAYDRGYFYNTDGLNKEEEEEIIKAHKNNMKWQGGFSHYIDKKGGDTVKLEFFFEKKGENEENEEKKLLLGAVEFELGIRQPGGDARNVDVILDLGNTRTAGLLFDHIANQQFNPIQFKQLFKILRIKPDPMSGEYDSLNDVEAGIAQSWIVLHELEHQTYKLTNAKKEPEILQQEYKINEVKEIREGFWPFQKTRYVVDGKVIRRIPQMFTQMSPVLLGDQAERLFNMPYAKAMISVGARIQQSSPKRYYWDDSQGNVWWSMLLNEWDPCYDVNPAQATSLPLLQGEMLRFIKEDGSILDLGEELQPVQQPLAFPTQPKYPKQSTLTWFLLRLLESAYAQSNSAFAAGANFIPHHFRKVLITYPSGWTNDEVEKYRIRCQEALDIFSHVNVYNGIKSELRLEMVSRSQTPDEAVAGQLPFVFSEIIRYPNQMAVDWISLVGKKRSDTDTVRIMNFDIGGGTTDISIVEYKDSNPPNSGAMLNLLTTTLLFKDGRALAGDDLVKKIIEQHILGGLLQSKKNIPGLQEVLTRKFTEAFNNKEDDAIRCRIIRTCLIPLATKCLSVSGIESISFSAQEAGVNQNNWKEFLEFIALDPAAIPITQPCFSITAHEINLLIEELFTELFKNCAVYAAAYDVDMVIFSGKPSELPHMRTMAQRFIPIDNERIIFAREFKAGQWYPFTDDNGYIKDAKTVTVVGAALYYALANGLIAGWKIESDSNLSEKNEWGEFVAMEGPRKMGFMSKDNDEASIVLLPNQIIARRRNKASSPEPVYKFISNDPSVGNRPLTVTFARQFSANGETLTLKEVDGSPITGNTFELKLWPCRTSEGIDFWQESGIFNL